MASCPICISDYNKSIKAPVKCYFTDCEYTACKECTRTYITNTVHDPHCMNCRRKWSLEFTKASLNASFMKTEYNNHRKEILTDRIISQKEEYYGGILALVDNRKRKHEIDDLREQINILEAKIRNHNDKIHENMAIMQGRQIGINAEPEKLRRQFIMQCQNSGCKGMLSQQYKCDLCEKYTCSKCLEPILSENHICNPDTIETAKLIKENTKPCPNCGSRISKIDGCDQMWCIDCKTAFSWSKGTIETGAVHNPHYFQWLRETGHNMENIRPGNCEQRNMETQVNIINKHNEFINSIRFVNYVSFGVRKEGIINTLNTRTNNMYTEIYLNAVHDNYYTALENFYFTNFMQYLVYYENDVLRQLHHNIEMRNRDRKSIYYFLMGEMSRENFSDFILEKDSANTKDKLLIDIIDALLLIGKQILNDFSNEINTEREKFLPIIEEIHTTMPEKYIYRENHYKTILTHLGPTIQSVHNTHNIFYSKKFIQLMADLYVQYSKLVAKYVGYIKKFTAYTNAEIIKYLNLYNSKRIMSYWDDDLGKMVNKRFANKDEMMTALETYQQMSE